MRVRIPQPSPFKEVDPDDVVVSELRVAFNGLEAYGYLKSEMRLHVHAPDIRGDGIVHGRHEPTATYRLAYQNADGAWQVEGTSERVGPPTQVMEQIVKMLAREP